MASFAADDTAPLNFENQLVKIFETTRIPPDVANTPDYTSPDTKKILARILDKLRHGRMHLKNVVYRTDMGAIRMTWADDRNDDIIKLAYKTGKDPILENSVYADKAQIVDVKITYRNDKGVYDYLHLQNDVVTKENTKKSDPANPKFMIEGHITDEKCRFCHELAKHDGSPSGVFFFRYQEHHGDSKKIGGSGMFDMAGFTTMPPESAAQLGLPAMSEKFLYRKMHMQGLMFPENARFYRSLLELPQLIEVMARDNGKSACVSVSVGPDPEKVGFGNSDYVCADNVAKKLYVRMTNKILTIHDGPVEYEQDYYVK